MESIAIVKNETNNHRLPQIDLDALAGSNEDIEDICDIIAVELRKGEETTP